MSHAILSPSGASRWLACTPSARLEQQFPDTSGDAAKEGTLAHALAESMLRYSCKAIRKAEYTKELNAIEANEMYNNDMKSHIEGYVEYVLERFKLAKKTTKDAVLHVETKLNITDYVPEGFGTGDAVIIADGVLEIIDLKFGKGVMVSAVHNKQMMLYALGALTEFSFLYDLRTVRMTIYQPRVDNISTFEMDATELKTWANDVLKPRAAMAFEGTGDFVPGEHCRFCRAKAQCRALAEQNLQLANYEFKDSGLLTDSEISDILAKSGSFKNWLSSVEDYALKEAISGRKFEGFKLVEGRSNRAYVDQTKVVQALLDAGIDEALIYEKSLLGITAMEKALSKKTFDTILSNLVIKPKGKPTLAPLSDKREEINSTNSAIEDFKNELMN